MHISKFEKFCIKHTIFLYIIVPFGFGILSGIASSSISNYDFRFINIIPAIAIFAFAEGLCIFITNNIRRRMDNFYSEELNPDAAITLVKEYLAIKENKKVSGAGDIYEKIFYYYDLLTYHCAKGEFEQVIDIYTKIRRDSSKINIGTYHDLSLRIFLALSYLNRGEKHLYDKELATIRELMSEFKIKRPVIAHQFAELKLLDESLFGGNDPKFEAKVFDFIYEKKSNGKVKNKKPTKMQLVSAYGLLLNYYELNEDSEKSTEYANKIIEMGNEQLAVYRTAKEYLENANKSN